MPRGKTAKSLALIDACADILQEMQPATVRAVCYQLFIRHLLPSMAKTYTNRVSTQLVYAREQEIIQLLRGDAQLRTEFINKIAAPVANKMFECGMIP